MTHANEQHPQTFAEAIIEQDARKDAAAHHREEVRKRDPRTADDYAALDRDEEAGDTLSSLAAWMDAQADDAARGAQYSGSIEDAEQLGAASALRECARQVRRIIEATTPILSNGDPAPERAEITPEGKCPHCEHDLNGANIRWSGIEFGDGEFTMGDDGPEYNGDADGDDFEVVDYFCPNCEGSLILPDNTEEMWS